ncbi:unnamed protein product [Peniophora sp. CBMAI 1063]|nr:unnamed protein product [Peniophora sp. CBMAI 1063]
MLNPRLTSLLEAWLVGPIYGANIILICICIHRLSTHKWKFSTVTRALLCTIFLLAVTTTAHAGLALSDLIVGFTRDDSLRYFLDAGRPIVVAALIVYAINVHVGDIFMAWRAYVMCNHNKILAICYASLLLAFAGASIAALISFTSARTLAESKAHAWTVTAWAMSVVIQTSGSVIIGWRIMSTPVAAPRTFDPWLVLWVFVDSGALYTCITILALSLSFPVSTASYVLTFSLGQISAFVPLTITLRECWKTDAELARQRVNATSTFLINERIHTRRSSISLPRLRYSSEPQVSVDITTTTRFQDASEEDIKEPVRTVPPLSHWVL